MSGNDRSDVRAFRELETLVRHLGEELANFRKRALQAESRLKDGGGASAKSHGGGERVEELERENAILRDRLSHAEERVTRVLERVRFLRQQVQLQPARVSEPRADA
jgi:predicted  nucleic acid-binding Zn-ribbon protein